MWELCVDQGIKQEIKSYLILSQQEIVIEVEERQEEAHLEELYPFVPSINQIVKMGCLRVYWKAWATQAITDGRLSCDCENGQCVCCLYGSKHNSVAVKKQLIC